MNWKRGNKQGRGEVEGMGDDLPDKPASTAVLVCIHPVEFLGRVVAIDGDAEVRVCVCVCVYVWFMS